MNGRTAAAFPFFYINPKGFPELIRRFAGEHLTDQEIEDMDPIGSSPVFIHKEDLRRVAPIWHDVTLKIKQDSEKRTRRGGGSWRCTATPSRARLPAFATICARR